MEPVFLFVLALTLTSVVFQVTGAPTPKTNTTIPSTTSSPPQYWDVNNFPNPIYNVNKCGRKGKQSYVCDPNNVLTYEEADRIDRAISDVRNNTPCPCVSCSEGKEGYMMTVAVVPWLKLPNGIPRTDSWVQRTIEDFANQLVVFQWSFGNCLNDAVIVLSKYDKKIYTATGSTTTANLPSDCVDEIASNAKYLLKKEKYADGISKMLSDYKRVINNPDNCDNSDTWVVVVAVVVPVVCVLGCVFFCLSVGDNKRRRQGDTSIQNSYFYGAVATSGCSGGSHGGGLGVGGGGASW